MLFIDGLEKSNWHYLFVCREELLNIHA